MAGRDRKTSQSPTTMSLTDSMSENEDWDASEWRKKFYEFRDSMQCRLQYIRGNIRCQMEQLAREKEEAEENCQRYRQQAERLQEQMEQLPLGDAGRHVSNGSDKFDIIEELQLELLHQRDEVSKFKRNTNMTIVEQQHLIEQLRRENEILQQYKSTAVYLEEKVRDLEAVNHHIKSDYYEIQRKHLSLQEFPDLLSKRIEETRRSLTNSLVSKELSQPILTRSSLSPPDIDDGEEKVNNFKADVDNMDDNNFNDADDDDDDENQDIIDNDINGDDYLEIEHNHQAIYAPRQLPPAIEMKRKKFQSARRISSETSMVSRSSELLVTAAATSARNSHRRSKSPAPIVSNNGKKQSSSSSMEPNYAHAAFVRDACATLPRQKRQSRPSQLDIAFNKGGGHEWRATSGKNERRLSKPPTPPLRKVASWEDGLYSLAECNGLKCDISLERSSMLNLIQPAQTVVEDESLHSALSGVDKRTTVPVFSVLQGKATRIHNIPALQPNCNSSDEEDESTRKIPQSNQVPTNPASPTIQQTKSSSSFEFCSGRPISKSNQPKKRAVSSNPSSGAASDVDYAQVAVDVSTCSDSEEPDEKVQRCDTPPFSTRELQRKGSLLKLGSRLKWKKVYCCAKCFVLICCKNETDSANPKHKECLIIDSTTKLRWLNGATTFLMSNSKFSWTFACDSLKDCRRWVKVLQNIIRKEIADSVLKQYHRCCQGRLIRASRGRRRTVWAVLVGHFLLFYRDSNDKLPLKTINVDQARIEDVDDCVESDCGGSTDSSKSGDGYKSLSIWAAGSRIPTYLLFVSDVEKDAWRSALSVAAGGGEGTQFEKILNDLQANHWSSDNAGWKNSILLRSNVCITEPLTSLTDQTTRDFAIEINKVCIQFINKPLSHCADSSLDYHVEKVQHIIQTCLDLPPLQDELICQLIKLTSYEYNLDKISGVQTLFCCASSKGIIKQTNSIIDLTTCSSTLPDNLERSWQLLAFAISFFLPKRHILTQFLKMHLQRNCGPQSHPLLTTHKFAAFSLTALNRAIENGCRSCRPSYVEVLSFLRHRPFEHSMPHSIAVSIMDGQHKVIGFDASTTVSEFVYALNVALKLPQSRKSGFALFADFSINEVEYCPSWTAKLCDVLAMWEQAYSSRLGVKFIRGQTVRLVFKNRLYYSRNERLQTEQERYLLCYQANDDVVQGRFPISRELALSLAALMAQITYGPYINDLEMPEIMRRFFPIKYRKMAAVNNVVDNKSAADDEMKQLQQAIIWKWMKQGRQTQAEYVSAYLNVLRRWKYFGAKLFPALKKFFNNQTPVPVFLAVYDQGIALLNPETLDEIKSFNYQKIITFGGCQNDCLLIVLSSKDYSQLLLVMDKIKMFEAVKLMANYINHMNAADDEQQPNDD